MDTGEKDHNYHYHQLLFL